MGKRKKQLYRWDINWRRWTRWHAILWSRSRRLPERHVHAQLEVERERPRRRWCHFRSASCRWHRMQRLPEASHSPRREVHTEATEAVLINWSDGTRWWNGSLAPARVNSASQCRVAAERCDCAATGCTRPSPRPLRAAVIYRCR